MLLRPPYKRHFTKSKQPLSQYAKTSNSQVSKQYSHTCYRHVTQHTIHIVLCYNYDPGFVYYTMVTAVDTYDIAYCHSLRGQFHCPLSI